MLDYINLYKKNGYIINNILSHKQCDEIIDFINNNDINSYYEKFNNNKFGHNFKLDDKPIKENIIKNKFIKNFATNILGDYTINTVKSYNKSSFMARDIEYHQEFYYNDHHPTRNNWEDYIQIFIALEDHSLENACLKIIPQSHKLGVLPYIDIVNSNLEHKKAVEYNSLKEAYNKFGILNCNLKKGEGILFNHLIIHGSQNNNGHLSRKSLVITINKSDLYLNKTKFNEFERKRKMINIEILENKINELKKQINKIN
jgi:ectoine hydroxylase-related dioxygenase (phytanoyl-CoA dioxygenase family)